MWVSTPTSCPTSIRGPRPPPKAVAPTTVPPGDETPGDPSPRATTTPPVSCPKTMGVARKFSSAHGSHRKMWRSVPHTLAASTRTSSSPGPGCGTGTSRSVAPGPGRSLTTASIVVGISRGATVIAPAMGPLMARLFGPGRSVAALRFLGRGVVDPLLVEGQEGGRVERIREHGAIPSDRGEAGAHLVEAGHDQLVLDPALPRDRGLWRRVREVL